MFKIFKKKIAGLFSDLFIFVWLNIEKNSKKKTKQNLINKKKEVTILMEIGYMPSTEQNNK